MEHSAESAARIASLLEAGNIPELHHEISRTWPVGDLSSREDVVVVSMLATVSHRTLGDRVRHIFQPYLAQLKSAPVDDRLWLSTLRVRSEAVCELEGTPAAVSWLRSLTANVDPPDVGFVHLVIGGCLLAA